MKITLAETAGFCFGVRDAVKKTEQLPPMQIFGDLIHNTDEVNRLAEKGYGIIERDLSKINGDSIIITAHGIQQQTIQQFKQKNMKIYDMTCPLVTAIYIISQNLEKEGYPVLIIGDKSHIEVQGIASRLNKYYIAYSEEDITSLPSFEKLGVVSQSTVRPELFNHLVSLLKPKVSDLKIKDTICSPTKKRQQAAHDLAKQVDLMIIIGGTKSSNTAQLTKVCSQYTTSYQIERPEDLKEEWFTNIEHVGVTAGASTPDWLIKKVVERIERI